MIWPNLAERLRNGESLLDLNRVGIEWRQEVCQVLKREIEEILEPFIEEKKKQIEVKPSVAPSEKINKLNRAICSLLNKLAKVHFSELPDIEPGEEDIKELTIKPPYANIEIDKERPFSVYAPINILGIGVGPYIVEVKSSNPTNIQVLNPIVHLQPHRKRPVLYYGNFRIIGRIDKAEATITCKLGEYTATADVRVAPLGKRGKPKEPKGAKGGFFREIIPDSETNPDQRVRYDEKRRTICIFVKFPGFRKYFEDNLSFKSDESKPMYAELIGEAFCKFTARDDIDKGRIPTIRGDDIGAFIIALNTSQKKYLHLIHEAIFKREL